MARTRSAGVYRPPRARPARPSLELIPDLALKLFAALEDEATPRGPARVASTGGLDRDHAPALPAL